MKVMAAWNLIVGPHVEGLKGAGRSKIVVGNQIAVPQLSEGAGMLGRAFPAFIADFVRGVTGQDGATQRGKQARQWLCANTKAQALQPWSEEAVGAQFLNDVDEFLLFAMEHRFAAQIIPADRLIGGVNQVFGAAQA